MFDKLKKALGFGPLEEDELIADDPRLQSVNESPFDKNQNQVHLSEDSYSNTVNSIFEHVVAQFNNALPEFLQKSVDPEKEKRILYESLNSDIKAHLKNLEDSVRTNLHEQWREERNKLQTDLKNISQTAKDIEAKRSELKSQQLSSERQRRALNDRIHDLERHVMQLEADKEQLELENKSMINKVKVAQVYEKDIQAMRNYIADLEKKIKDGPKNDAQQNQPFTTRAEDEEKLKNLSEENNNLKKQINDLKQIEKEYSTLSNKMEEVETLIVKFEEIKASKDEKITTLQTQLKEARSLIDSKSDELKKATDRIKQLQGTIDGLNEDIRIKERDIKIPEKAEPIVIESKKLDDDTLDDADWIVQPKNKRERSNQQTQRPRNKKYRNHDDGQMSLW